jgi:hypothetical protein
VFQFFQPLDIGGRQAPVRGVPLIVRRGTDVVAPPDLVDGTITIWVSVNFDWRMETSWLGDYCARKFSFWTVSDWGKFTAGSSRRQEVRCTGPIRSSFRVEGMLAAKSSRGAPQPIRAGRGARGVRTHEAKREILTQWFELDKIG